MLGLRGVPQVQGGVEKHVEELARVFVEKGWDVEVLGRKPYLTQKKPYQWEGVQVTPLWAPLSTKFEAIAHTFLGVLVAAVRRPDILHIHAIGPALLTPLARLLGLKTVVTHHGFDYNRDKWGGLARKMLKTGEWAGMRFASQRIAVSRHIAEAMAERYQVSAQFIPNGVTLRETGGASAVLQTFALEQKKYVVMVARIVPEKNQHDLIAAFAAMQAAGFHTDKKLAIVGAADHQSPYVDQVKALAAKTPNIVLTGMQRGDDLTALYSNAALFILPSSHEGMPIAMMEAMGYGLPVLASDITANLEVGLPEADYFPLGDTQALAKQMAEKLDQPFSAAQAAEQSAEIAKNYSWSGIADQTLAVYQRLL
ncbi:glycosyltransferase family 4 protein [Pseudochrobactrum algeriensis]|nr:glycosyltransferase family 4 protein [Ochrobactrum sp. MR34]QVQ38311.1 glycosyltransferase family 4 protein [Pseudochrobactrum algeriensis]QVQ41535.1 glycosyltransferase family 4 protein [Pseudochrobactrum algeriensis]QVQ45459.1 glycosyltransferase family 4 protein [Pseudochrobactrum algeriensis]